MQNKHAGALAHTDTDRQIPAPPDSRTRTHTHTPSLSNSLTNSHAGGVARRAVTPYGNDTIIWPGSEPPPEPAESWRKVKDPRRSDGTSMWVGVATNEVG